MKALSAIALAMLLAGCATTQPHYAAPTALRTPQPIVGNGGKYMSPFTEDGTIAPWVEKGRSAKAGSAVGGFVGAQAGQRLAQQIPLFGSLLGQSLGEGAGRAVALQMVGGETYIKENSDLSFATVQDLALYMYTKNSSHKDYAEAFALTEEIYPELKQAYYPAIANASNVTAR